MSQRRQIVLPDPVDEQLRQLATAADKPPSTLAAEFVQDGIAQALSAGKIQRPRATSTIAMRENGQRPVWLEPYGGSREWRQRMWGEILALHARYPTELEALKDNWWTNETTLGMLCALATWRAEIDDNGPDPREEITFLSQLTDYANQLRQQSGGIAKTWKPGAPPAAWTGTSLS